MKILGMSAALLFLLVGLSGAPQETAQPGTAAVVGSDGIQRLEISGGDYYFAPNIIVLKVNVPAELTVKKMPGRKPHKITMRSPEAGMDFSVALHAAPQTIKFTPTKVGVYTFWCPERAPLSKSHRDRGMTGKIEVVQ